MPQDKTSAPISRALFTSSPSRAVTHCPLQAEVTRRGGCGQGLNSKAGHSIREGKPIHPCLHEMALQSHGAVSQFSKYWHENAPVNCSDMESLRGHFELEKLILPTRLSNPPLAAQAWGSEGGRKPGRLRRPPDTPDPCLLGLPPIFVCLGGHFHSQDILTRLLQAPTSLE